MQKEAEAKAIIEKTNLRKQAKEITLQQLVEEEKRKLEKSAQVE